MTTQWIEVPGDCLPDEEDVSAFEVNGKSICLYRLNGQYFATDNQCTHGDAELAEGMVLDDGIIECPLHEGTFDIRTGKALAAPCTIDLRTYETKADQGVIYLKLVN